MSNTLHAAMPVRPEAEKPAPEAALLKAERLRSLAEQLGYFSPKRQSLHRVLRDFSKSVEPRTRFAPLYPHEAEFARNAFEYLRDVDCHLESATSLAAMTDIVSRIDRPMSGFDVDRADICRLKFGDRHALELRGCPELLEPLATIIKGWNLGRIDSDDGSLETAMRIWKRDGRYLWDMPFPGPYCGDDVDEEEDDDEEPLTSVIDALHEVHFFLDDVDTLENPSHFFLHAAAVEIGEAIVLFLGTHRTGKSSLAMALAARGHRVLADDRLAVDCRTGHAVALGSTPLLRKPLPADEGFWPAKSLIKKNRGLQDDEYIYVDLPEALFAPRGYSRPIAVVVDLELSLTPIATTFEEISKADSLRELVSRHYRKALKASEAFDGMLKIAETTRAYSLKYSRTKTAVREIERMMVENGFLREDRLVANG